MQKPVILISGKNGQLGNELQDVAVLFPQFHYRFFDKDELNITEPDSLNTIFNRYKPAYFINAAAYTAVDKAETEQERAWLINAEAISNIAKVCNNFHTKLIHISTDYVFDGKTSKPYKENDTTAPVNYYGFSKWMGEQLALENNPLTVIIRTSWVYSTYGNNFVKTMLRLMRERTSINVVTDQYGSPTYAKDLAETIFRIIKNAETTAVGFCPGIYHYSNEGIISWYDFATAIKNIKNLSCSIQPINTSQYPTPAQRPAYSAMSKDKIKRAFHVDIKDWKLSLRECLTKL